MRHLTPRAPIGMPGQQKYTPPVLAQATMVLTAVRLPGEAPLRVTSQELRQVQNQFMYDFISRFVAKAGPLLVEADGDLASPAGAELQASLALGLSSNVLTRLRWSHCPSGPSTCCHPYCLQADWMSQSQAKPVLVQSSSPFLALYRAASRPYWLLPTAGTWA